MAKSQWRPESLLSRLRTVTAAESVPRHSGMKSAAGWSIGVFHPVSGALDRVFVLRDRAIATSGNSEQTHLVGRLRIGHLFDARRGRPANGHLSASVVAATGVESDRLSTTAYLLGPDRFRGWAGALQP